jgi:hypothetical protein
MPKFISPRDVAFFKHIARELVDDVVQNIIILYKVNLNQTRINLYGEALTKTWHKGVELNALIDKEPSTVTYEGFGADVNQNISFKVDRFACEEKNAYPEIGDVIYFDTHYYEIDNTSEIQFAGGLPINNFSIVCTAFLTNTATLGIEERKN